MSAQDPTPPGELERILAPIREDRVASAILTDVDGTIAPIVLDPGEAAVPDRVRELLRILAGGYGLVGCISGRRALDARRIVGVEELTYAGNHGYELLEPGETEPRPDPALNGHEADAKRFLAGLDPTELERVGVRSEDKGAIVALHWRGATSEEEAESLTAEIAEKAERGGLVTHRGRKVLELRPPVPVDKGTAVGALVRSRALRATLYAGDDRTDVDAFAALHELRAAGEIDSAVCVAVTSAESPAEVERSADIAVDGPEGFIDVLETLAR